MLNDMYIIYRTRKGKLDDANVKKLLILGYSLVNLSQKQLSLDEKMQLVLGCPLDLNLVDNIVQSYKDNNISLSVLFILGFFLGHGTFSFRIRDGGHGLWFIPRFRFFQKNTKFNTVLFNNIESYLQSLSVPSSITITKKLEDNRLQVLTVEGVKASKLFYELLSKHKSFFF